MTIDLGQKVTGNAGSITNNSSLTVDTAGSRKQIPSFQGMEVLIIAKASNTGYIYIGDSNVSSTKHTQRLLASDSAILSVSDSSQIYIDSSVSGEGIFYTIIG